MKVKTITIDARRWFQKTYGNTYHSVRVYVNNEYLGGVDFAYGYDRQYIQTAFDILSNNGIFPYRRTKKLATVNAGEGAREYQTPQESINKHAAWEKFNQDMRDHRAKYHITCVDVDRKRDL